MNGRQVYRAIRGSDDVSAAVAGLSDKRLRKLLGYMEGRTGAGRRALVHGMAIVQAAERWMRKG